MKHLLRFLKCFLKFLLLELPLQLIGAILLLIWLPIQRKLNKRNPARSWRLPTVLRWFDNADMYVGRDTSTYLNTVIPQGWLYQYYWLAWRNPLNYFGYVYMGTIISEGTQDLTYYKSVNGIVGNDIGCIPGFFYREIKDPLGTIYYEYYYIKAYTYRSGLYCIRIRIGYKLGQQQPIVQGPTQNVFVISPFHSYNGSL